jgi:hypothetical protein
MLMTSESVDTSSYCIRKTEFVIRLVDIPLAFMSAGIISLITVFVLLIPTAIIVWHLWKKENVARKQIHPF